MTEFYVGQPVRVLKGIKKAYRGHTFIVRCSRNSEVCVDNGHPQIEDPRANGFTVAAWLPRSSVEPWDGPAALTQSAIAAERAHAMHDEIKLLQAQQIRLLDLVRHQRAELHEAGLLTDEEYAALAAVSESPCRLETYDKIIEERDKLRAAALAWGRWCHSTEGMEGELFDAAVEALPEECFPYDE